MKRVLVITYYWPPTGGSGVQRWVKFAKYLPDEGWEPVIYTPENPEQTSVDETLVREVSPSLEVIRTPIREPYNIYRRLVSPSAFPFGSGPTSLSPIRGSDGWGRASVS